ncbi:MAG TPA: hypothetical protein VGM41_21540 [Chitinophagaceae bacterium]|jgi:hypothetical protein
MYARIYLALLLLVLSSCNLDGKDKHKHKTAGDDTSWDTDTASDMSTVKLVPIGPQEKPEAGQYCYIKKVYEKEGDTYIDADYIQFLMGDSAIAAAKKKGEADAVQDDYYVVNDNPKIRTLKLSSHFELVALENTVANGTVPTAVEYVQMAVKNEWIAILTFDSNGEVVRIKQQYLP